MATSTILTELIGLNPIEFGDVLGGSRWIDQVNYIRALLKFRAVYDLPMLVKSLEQAGKLKKVRDEMAHWCWTEIEGGFYLTKSPNVIGTKDIAFRLYSLEYLNQLARHARVIANMLYYGFRGPQDISFAKSTMNKLDYDALKAALDKSPFAEFPEQDHETEERLSKAGKHIPRDKSPPQ